MNLRIVAFTVTALVYFSAATAPASTTGGPAAAQIEYAKAQTAFESGDLQRASDLYSKILADDADQPLAWFRLGAIHQQLGTFRAALHAYDTALSYVDKQGVDAATQELAANIRFNRATLLLGAAAEDLQMIPADELSLESELARESMQRHVDEALLGAGNRSQRPSLASKKANTRARSYIYNAQAGKRTLVASPTEGKPLPITAPSRNTQGALP